MISALLQNNFKANLNSQENEIYTAEENIDLYTGRASAYVISQISHISVFYSTAYIILLFFFPKEM